ncbi:MAG TPA: multicopper oxidase domain-containing protein [Candidatus Limnocylindrales bacterium]|nr:multicopper oxidase domain-containing protein [Candidatus Limnocylindrales bacterium]
MEDTHTIDEDALRAALSRRRFLRGSAVGAVGVAAATVAACAPAALPGWTYRSPSPSAPGTPGASGSPSPSGSPVPTASMNHATPSPTGSPPTDDMDALAEAVVARFPEQTAAVGNQVLAPRIEGDAKVFEIAASAFEWHVDAIKPTVSAVGYNGTWPGPQLRVTEGDLVRVVHTNNLSESTGMHFHGQNVPNAVDGVPFLTQRPIRPGETFVYEFTAGPFGSHMYHSHHNATDQVGRGMLGAFIVEPRDPALRYQVDQDIVWISNDALGGFTINGKGFPATAPIVAQRGERILVRFMNEGVMSHPWHLHGMPMHVVARDGYPLGSAAFTCDTIGVNPGERWDVIIDANNPGVWAFHCHILTHAEGHSGMFGMVTALIVEG